MIIIPLWLIIFFAAMNIIGIYWCSKIKKIDSKRTNDEKRRELISIVPRLYFLGICLVSLFLGLEIDLELRLTLGRYGIIAILVVDTWIKFAEIFDHYWESSWKYKSKYKF